jgi:hypothetical protein
MPTDTREPQHSAVTEAARITAETSRRTVDGAKAAVEATRGLLDDSTEASRKLFDAWTAGAEATLKATFELQNASLSAGSALLEAASTSQRTVVQQWDTAAHGAQQAALEAFRAQVRAISRLFDPAPAGR